MTEENDPKKPELTLVRGRKGAVGAFASLSLPEKLSRLREAPSKERMEMIIADPAGMELARGLRPQELYWTIKDIGPADAVALLALASPEQLGFILDMELWPRAAFSRKQALEWLGYLVDAGEETVVEQLRHLDPELLLLILTHEIAVGGGVGELASDDERTTGWDHSFDNLYFISFRNPKSSRLIGTLLDIAFRLDHDLYQTLMEGVKNGIESELEEEEGAFRTGRLADLGFPARDEAISIYARIDPDSFAPASEEKKLLPGSAEFPPAPIRDGSLLARTLGRLDPDGLLHELNYLMNSALVVEDAPHLDSEGVQGVMERVSGYLAIALEFLCGDDEERAAAVLKREPLKRLFQLGHALVLRLKKKTEGIAGAGYAAGRVLEGLRADRPKFYRGLDGDGVDGYREFAAMADVKKIEEFLEGMGG